MPLLKKMDSFTNFEFSPSTLAAPRRKGISAIMRIKNGDEFLRIAIESHLPYVDEIVACYNQCTDTTESILNDLALTHPEKIRPIKYLPHVYPILSEEHRNTPTESIHSTANYYNFALNQARFSYAFKLDDDHLAIENNFLSAINKVRQSINLNQKKLFTFSGLNLIRSGKDIGVFAAEPLVGSGDHMFFPVCENIYFRQDARTEIFHFTPPKFEKEYIGLIYMHLKYCKKTYGLHNLDPNDAIWFQNKIDSPNSLVPFENFRKKEQLKRFIDEVNPIEYWLRTNPFIQRIIFNITKKNPPLKIARAHSLFEDLKNIDFENEIEYIIRK